MAGKELAVKGWIGQFVFILLTLGAGSLIGVLFGPDDWYRGLAKPAFTPPGWVFALVWNTLYIMIGVAGWRTWRRDPGSGAMKLWWTQLALNLAWTPVFFAAHMPLLALLVVLALLAVVLAFILLVRRADPPSAWLMLPYAAWIAFAALLNGMIVALN